jgi:Protein of unknown function (DUF4232)
VRPGRYQEIMKRRLALLSVLVLPVVATAACSSTGGGTPAAGSSTPAGTSSIGTASPSPSSSPTKAGSPTPSKSPTATTAQAAGTPRCHTGDLSLKIGTGGGAAGTEYENLVFTNKSGHKCTLYGYPGVSWVAGDNGTQVNAPFERDGGTKHTITLAARGTGHAVLATAATGTYPDDKCKPVKARGFRIYPPDETASIFVSQPQTVCSAKGVGLGRVQPISAGPGSAG